MHTLNISYLSMRVFLRIVNIIFASSSASLNKLSYCSTLMKSVSFNNDIQNLVSRHSLYEIEIFEEKSAFEIPPLASAIFAPILVPHFNNCLDKTNSRFSLHRY